MMLQCLVLVGRGRKEGISFYYK